MTRVELNQFNMMQSVDQFFTINHSLISSNPAIVSTAGKLKSLIGDINALSQVQAVSTKTESTIKANARNSMIDNVLKVAAGMSAHAATTGDTRLKMTADIVSSDLKKMRDSDLVIKIRALYDAALPVATELAVWGVVQADIDKLNTDAGQYTAQSPDIRNLKVKTVQATSDLKAKLDEANALIKNNLDAMMLPFKNLNPSLHGEYLNARAIINRAATQTPAPPKEG